ncbi:MAG: N-acetylmuramoyl-L-alanine amidase, partial [Hominenteromicrobium sp.]
MKKYISFKISYMLTAFFLGALVLFLCSVFGAVHAVSTAAEETESRPTLVLDAGHGGEDGGAVGVNGVEEKNINLAIALSLQEKLTGAGYNVVMIRDTDTAVGDTSLGTLSERKRSDIQYRAQVVNETENCILVSIHQNYFEQSQYSGAQMFYSDKNEESERL